MPRAILATLAVATTIYVLVAVARARSILHRLDRHHRAPPPRTRLAPAVQGARLPGPPIITVAAYLLYGRKKSRLVLAAGLRDVIHESKRLPQD